MTEADLAKTLEGLSAAATQGEWGIWREPISSRHDAIAELTEQVDATKSISDALVLLDAGGLCPASTGCGPTSDANAEFITALVNTYRTGQLIVVDHPQATSPVDEPINATDAAFMAGEAIYQRDGVSPFLREVMQLKRDNNAKLVDDRGGAVCEQQAVEAVKKLDFNAIEVAIAEGLIMELDMDDDNDSLRIEQVSTAIAKRVRQALGDEA